MRFTAIIANDNGFKKRHWDMSRCNVKTYGLLQIFVMVNPRYSVVIVLHCAGPDSVLFHHNQVNSKGYKVCGEASSVCGTITINKRKVNDSLLLSMLKTVVSSYFFGNCDTFYLGFKKNKSPQTFEWWCIFNTCSTIY